MWFSPLRLAYCGYKHCPLLDRCHQLHHIPIPSPHHSQNISHWAALPCHRNIATPWMGHEACSSVTIWGKKWCWKPKYLLNTLSYASWAGDQRQSVPGWKLLYFCYGLLNKPHSFTPQGIINKQWKSREVKRKSICLQKYATKQMNQKDVDWTVQGLLRLKAKLL